MVSMRVTAAVFFVVGAFGLFVGALGLSGVVQIARSEAILFLIGGLGFAAFGLQFMAKHAQVLVNVGRPTVRFGSQAGQQRGVSSTVTARTERIAIRNVNGQWTIDVSGDPLAAKNPEVQRQIIDQLRNAGTVPQAVLDAVAAKLGEPPKSDSAGGGI